MQTKSHPTKTIALLIITAARLQSALATSASSSLYASGSSALLPEVEYSTAQEILYSAVPEASYSASASQVAYTTEAAEYPTFATMQHSYQEPISAPPYAPPDATAVYDEIPSPAYTPAPSDDDADYAPGTPQPDDAAAQGEVSAQYETAPAPAPYSPPQPAAYTPKPRRGRCRYHPRTQPQSPSFDQPQSQQERAPRDKPHGAGEYAHLRPEHQRQYNPAPERAQDDDRSSAQYSHSYPQQPYGGYDDDTRSPYDGPQHTQPENAYPEQDARHGQDDPYRPAEEENPYGGYDEPQDYDEQQDNYDQPQQPYYDEPQDDYNRPPPSASPAPTPPRYPDYGNATTGFGPGSPKNTTAPNNSTTSNNGGAWSSATATWYGTGDSVGSTDPTKNSGSCFHSQGNPTAENTFKDKYHDFYAAVNDGGPLYGGEKCTPTGDPYYPACGNQKNCWQCYEIRCKSPRQPGSKCKTQTQVVMVIDACPMDSQFQKNLEAQNGKNLCREAGKSGQNHFDISKQALNSIRDGECGEIDIEYRPVSC